MTLFLIAGHHRGDAGAVAHGLEEATLTRALRDKLAGVLRAQGLVVFTEPDTLNLSETMAFVRERFRLGDVLIDLHFNAASATATGTEAFIRAVNPTPLERALAQTLTQTVSLTLNIPNRGVKPDNHSQHQRLGILYTGPHSVLLEVCFMTNRYDMAQYKAGLAGNLVPALAKSIVEVIK